MTLLTPPEKPESRIITADFRSPLEQWAVEAAKSIEVVPEETSPGGPGSEWERVVLVNDHAGLADREEATIARCRSGDGTLVASAMHALIERVRRRAEAAEAPIGGVLPAETIQSILAVRHDPRALVQRIEAVIADREEAVAISEDGADDGEPLGLPDSGEDASEG